MKKRFLCWMLCLCLLGGLAACRTKPAEEGLTSESPQSETDPGDVPEPEEPETVIPSADLSNYVIIYPENATDELVQAANALASAIGAQFGVSLRVKNDFYSDMIPGMEIGEYEILLGATNREESAAFLQSLGFRDRGYTVIGKKVVIAAHDDYTASLAVSDFNLNVVINAKHGAEVFYSSVQNTTKTGDYRFGTMTIDGAEISDYRIVYPENGTGLEKLLATKLQKAIADACGDLLEVVTDATGADGTQEILIGKTNRSVLLGELDGVTDGSGYTALEGGSVVLCGNNALGNATAVDAFLGCFAQAESAESMALQIPSGLHSAERENGAMSAMTFNVFVGDMTAARMERVVENIVRYLPDTVGLQECSVQWRNYITKELSDYYAYVGIGRENGDTGEACGILYAKDKFNLIETGTKWLTSTPDEVSQLPGAEYLRVYTWVTLERKTDGVQFMHLNTHLDTAGSDIRQTEAAMLVEFLYEHRDLAIVMTGDFNCSSESTEFAMLVSEFMRNCAEIAAEKDMGSFTVNGVIDFLLAYDLYIDVQYYEISDDRINGDYASDHRAGYIEYVIDYNGTPVQDNENMGDGNLVVVPDREGADYDDPVIVF